MKKFIANVCYFESLINSMKSLSSFDVTFETFVYSYDATILVKFKLSSQCALFYSLMDALCIRDCIMYLEDSHTVKIRCYA